MNRHVPGLVYYALDAWSTGLVVKIGFTTNMRQRLVALRRFTASRQTPIVLAVEAGSLHLEEQRHVEFAGLRTSGEWFTYTPPLTDHIASLGHPYDLLSGQPDLHSFTDGWLSFHRPPAPPKPGEPIYDFDLDWHVRLVGSHPSSPE